jgi:hypothetical protein
MYNRMFLDRAHDQIASQIAAMPSRYFSNAFYATFEANHGTLYDEFVGYYMGKGHDRPHAIQIVNQQLMHTVNACFSHLTRKIRTVPNPKGGDMSEWERL